MVETPHSRLTTALGVLFCRILVPGWLLTGAVFKLYYRDPQSLPESIWRPAYELSVNLDLLLRLIIAAEIVIAGIMFFSRRFSRLTAVALLVFFCIILVHELDIEAASCGCLGKVVMPPEIMLAIDIPLLIGVLAFRPHARRPAAYATRAKQGQWATVAISALGWLFISVGVAFGVPDIKVELQDPNPIQPPRDPVTIDRPPQADPPTEPQDQTGAEPGGEDDDADPPTEPPPQHTQPPEPSEPALPAFVPKRPPSYFVFEPDEWVGQRWSDLELASYLNARVTDVENGRRYLIFYNPTCDHCYGVLKKFFTGELPAPTTVIAIPEYKDRFEPKGKYPMPCKTCEKLQLGLGCNYIVTPPVIIALEDGVIVCAKEAVEPDEPHCLNWH